MYPYILTSKNLTIIIDAKQYSITSDHDNFDIIIDKIKKLETDDILKLISIKEMIKGITFGNIIVGDDDKLYYNNIEIHNVLTDKIISMYKNNFHIQPMINFLENILMNPEQSSIDELYKFLEHGNLPITDDGCFLAYKKVNEDFTDCYTGTYDNSIGTIVKMDRSDVNDNRNITCSTGLHFCSFGYLCVYPDHLPIMILKINPRDVVSIPVDYNNTKGRCCEYKVEAQYHDAHKSQFDSPVSNSDIIKMTVRQKIIYSIIKEYFLEFWKNDTLDDIDFHELRNNYNLEYEMIIEKIRKAFPKYISRPAAVAHYKFFKNNFGAQ